MAGQHAVQASNMNCKILYSIPHWIVHPEALFERVLFLTLGPLRCCLPNRVKNDMLSLAVCTYLAVLLVHPTLFFEDPSWSNKVECQFQRTEFNKSNRLKSD